MTYFTEYNGKLHFIERFEKDDNYMRVIIKHGEDSITSVKTLAEYSKTTPVSSLCIGLTPIHKDDLIFNIVEDNDTCDINIYITKVDKNNIPKTYSVVDAEFLENGIYSETIKRGYELLERYKK